MEREMSRRRTLQMGAAAVGVGSLAGCSTVTNAIPFIGGGANYANWVIAPGEIGDDDHLNFSYTDYSTIVNNEDEFDSDYYGNNYESAEDSFPLSAVDLDIDEIDSDVSVSRFGGHISANYNQDDVAGELEDNDYDDDTDHEGYTIYLGENERRAVAIDGSDIVYARRYDSDTDAVGVAEALIDTGNGNEDRYADDSDAFNTLVNQMGSVTVGFGATRDAPSDTNAESGQFEGNVANGFSATVNGDTTDVGVVLVFESQDDVDMDDIEEYQDSDTFDEIDDVSSSQNGNAVVISGSIDTDDLQDAF